MDFLGNLSDDRRKEYRDFVDRYDQGPPYDSITEEEALNRYREVVSELSGEDYRHSAREAIARMTSEERVEIGRQLRDLSLQRGYVFPDRDAEGQDERLQDPDYLAQMTEAIHREHPELISSLIGDGGAGLMGGMMGGGMTGGEGASGEGGMLGNPIAKAAIIGITAATVKRVMEGS